MLNLGIGLGLSGGAGGAGVVLGAAEFYAPLTHSLVLTRGTGDPTYTRATASWEFDNEGKLITVPSGAARFGGARMVRNYVTNTAAGNSVRPVFTATGSSPPTVDNADTYLGVPCSSVEIPICSGGFSVSRAYTPSTYTSALGTTSTVTSRMRIAASRPLVGTEQIRLYFGSATAHGVVDLSTSNNVGPDWADITGETITNSTELTGNSFVVQSGTGSNYASPITVYVTDVQYENVTGQADQTAGEYVSSGVLSAPYHGAGVNGVKWFNTNKDGSAIPASSLLGNHAEGARTNSLLYSRDLTNAAWAKTNITAAKTATGIDNAANSASTLTAAAADATILQTLSLAAAPRSFSAYVTRRTGVGPVYITRDGFTTEVDISGSLQVGSLADPTKRYRVKIENSSVLNPQVGFKIATSGDAIDVDVCQDEAGSEAWSPIITTTAAVTRNADAETFPTASNWSDTAGWALATVQGESWANATGTAIGNGTNGLKLSASNSGVVAYDGTNTVNGPAGSPSGAEKLAMTWGGGALQAASGGVAGTAGSYDGAWGLATVGIGTSQGNVYIKDVYIGQSKLTEAQLQQVTA